MISQIVICKLSLPITVKIPYFFTSFYIFIEAFTSLLYADSIMK